VHEKNQLMGGAKTTSYWQDRS